MNLVMNLSQQQKSTVNEIKHNPHRNKSCSSKVHWLKKIIKNHSPMYEQSNILFSQTISVQLCKHCHSSYGDFIDIGRLLTKKRVDQGYTLDKLKIYFRKFYGRYNALVQHYNTPLLQFLWPSPLLMCVKCPGLDPTGYDC